MSNKHNHSTRLTTKIEETINELTARLPQRKRMSKSNVDDENNIGEDGLNSGNGNERMEWLLMELAQLREQLGRFQLHQQQQTILANNPNMPTMQVVMSTDPLQQMKDFVKPFYGNREEDVYKWIESITHYFNVARLPGDQDALYLQYAPAFLKSYAYEWWKENKRPDWTWLTFKQSIFEQFGKTNEYLIDRLLDQRKQQYNESVIKYYYDVIDLCNKYDSNMSDKQKVHKLTKGLRFSLYQEAIKQTYTSPTDFLIKVQQIENVQQLIEHRQMQMDQEDQRRTTMNNPQMNVNQYRANERVQCYRCKEYGHISTHCPQAKEIHQTNQKNE